MTSRTTTTQRNKRVGPLPGPRRRGAAMVEMALVLPLLIALLFGIIEYGWMFFRAAQVNQAARHGARTAVRPAASVEEVEDAVASVMDGAGLGDSGYTIVLTPEDLVAEVGEPLTVEVSLEYGPQSLTGFDFLPTPESLYGHSTMAKEGPP